MTEGDALHAAPESEWRLLLQFVPPDGPGGAGDAVQRVAEGLAEIALPAAEMERVRRAVGGAVQTASESGNRGCVRAPLCIRVWVSGGCTEDAAQSDPADRPAGRPLYCSWGFFLVQKQEESLPTGAGERRPAIDLFLYRERSRLAGYA